MIIHTKNSNLSSLIPGGTSTNAKSPFRRGQGDKSDFTTSASGPWFIDNNGKKWLDCDMGLGAVTWGHCHPEIDEAVIAQIKNGNLFSAPPLIEGQAAELILSRLQVFNSIRFAKNGSDVTTAAIRVARAATGRKHIVSATYHGWHDWTAHPYYKTTGLGIPAEVGELSININEEKYSSIEHILDSTIAAVIVCPEHWTKEDLRLLSKSCKRLGIVLIFDEVKSGARFGLRGVFHEYDIKPDLLCLSKGLANGYSIAALVGSDVLMAHTVSVKMSGTYATECVGLAAAIACEKLLIKQKTWPTWGTLTENIIKSTNQYIQLISPNANIFNVTGNNISICISIDDTPDKKEEFKKHLISEFSSRNIFTNGWLIFSDSHNVDMQSTIGEAIFSTLEKWIRKIQFN